MRHAVAAAIRTTLVKHLGPDVMLFLDDIAVTTSGTFAGGVGEAATIAVIGMPPLLEKIYLQIDQGIVGMVIDRLLGGTGRRGVEPIPLTETEQGVLQYLVMDLLAALHAAAGPETPFHFRFERFIRHAVELGDLLPPRESVALCTWRCGLSDTIGIIRLAIPDSFAVAARLPERSQGDLAVLATQRRRFANERLPVWVEAGRCALTPTDLVALEVGDVVLFDQTELTLRDARPSGRVMLRLGQGTHGGIRCALAAGETMQCAVEDFEESEVMPHGEAR